MQRMISEISTEGTEAVQEFIDTISGLTLKEWLIGLGILIVLLGVSHFLIRLFITRLNKSERISKSLHTVLVALVRFALIMGSILISANAVGVSVSAFMIIFTVVAAAVALAAQGVLNNIAGCIILLSGHLFDVGDYIETPDTAGTVQEINLLNTKLLSYEGYTIYIPNSVLYTTTVSNLTSHKKRRANLSFRVAAKHSPEEVRKAAFEAIAKIPAALDDPAPVLVVNGYTAGHVNYLLLVWAPADNYWPVRNGVNEQLYTTFRENGIEMFDKDVSVVMSDQ